MKNTSTRFMELRDKGMNYWSSELKRTWKKIILKPGLDKHCVISLVYFQLLKLIWRSERLLPAQDYFGLENYDFMFSVYKQTYR